MGAERLRVHCDTGEPARAAAPRRFGHQGDAGEITNGLGVGVEDAPVGGHTIRQYLHLAAAYSGQMVAHAVNIADIRVLVVRGRVTRLGGELARVVNQGFVGRDTSRRRRW